MKKICALIIFGLIIHFNIHADIVYTPYYNVEMALKAEQNGVAVKALSLGSNMSGCSSENNEALTITRNLVKLQNIEILMINSCDLRNGIPEFITELRNLRILEITFNHNLYKLPDNIGSFKNLEELYLANNQLESLPDSIGNLVSLKELDLRGNRLDTLPKNFYQLMNLNFLDISNNIFEKIPYSILNLVNIKDLRVRDIVIPFGKKYPLYQDVWEVYAPKIFHNSVPIIPKAYIVKATIGLSLRSNPNSSATKIGVMPYGLVIAVYEKSESTETIDGRSAPWMRIKAVVNGKYMEGWAWSGYLHKNFYFY